MLGDIELAEALPTVMAEAADYPYADRIADWLRFRQGDTDARIRLADCWSLDAYSRASITGMARSDDIPVVVEQAESRGSVILAFEVYWRSGLLSEVERLLDDGTLSLANVGNVSDANVWLRLVERIDPRTGGPTDEQTGLHLSDLQQVVDLQQWEGRDSLHEFLLERTRTELSLVRKFAEAGVVGVSPEMRTLYGHVSQLCTGLRAYPRQLPHILMTGPIGSGKGRISSAVHTIAGRQRDLVHVNCAALSGGDANIARSEIFGHKEGAYSNAAGSRRGAISRADGGGTILLDEIDKLPLQVQGQLLEVLQEGTYTRLGDDTKVEVKDVLFMAATNRQIADLAGEGAFLPDLVSRLSDANLEVPSLKVRLEEVPLLTNRFLSSFGHTSVDSVRDRVGAFLIQFCQNQDEFSVRALEQMVGRIVRLAADDAYQSLERKMLEGAYSELQAAGSSPPYTLRAVAIQLDLKPNYLYNCLRGEGKKSWRPVLDQEIEEGRLRRPSTQK
jgi:transcriptional regulator with AAA-type ATPase domain